MDSRRDFGARSCWCCMAHQVQVVRVKTVALTKPRKTAVTRDVEPYIG
jgi:hypothetical protein